MTPTLVFSRDRAAQLDLLLRSTARFAPWVEATVLYTCAPAHANSYRTLAGEHADTPFLRERDFEAQTRAFLAEHERFLWLVDDALFIRRCYKPISLPWALRSEGSHEWAEHDPQSERGWATVVGGTVYKTSMILPLLDFRFGNPNQLERGLHDRRSRFEPQTIYGAEQALVSIEHNAVSPDSWNPTMGGDPDELRERFDAGGRLDLDALVAALTPAHVQIPLVWADAQ